MNRKRLRKIQTKKNLFNIGLSSKLMFGMLLIVLVPVMVAGYASYKASTRIFVNSAVNELEYDSVIVSSEVEDKLNKIIDSLFVVVNFETVNKLSSDIDANTLDPLVIDHEDDLAYRLQDQFSELLANDRNIVGAVYVGSDGFEVVRVEFDGSAINSEPNQLSSVRGLDYFESALRLRDGQVSSTELGLDTFGRRVVTYSSPVFKDNAPVGVIALTIDLDKVVDDVFTIEDDGYFNYVIANTGEYVVHSDELKQFGAVGESWNISKDYSDNIVVPISSGNSGTIESRDSDLLMAFNTIRPKSVTSDNYFVVFNKVSRSEVLLPLLRLRNLLFFVVIIFAVMLVGASYVIAKVFIKPISALTVMATALARGDYNSRMRSNTNDELGALSDAFNSMSDQLFESKTGLEDKISKRTIELNEKKQMLERKNDELSDVLREIEVERDRATNERNKIETILHSIGDGVFVIDRESKIFVANTSATDISGYKVNELIGKKYKDVFKFIGEKTQDDRGGFIEASMNLRIVQELDLYSGLVDRSGKMVAVSATASPLVSDEGVIGCVVVFRDVARERAVDRAKSEFVSLASHQLSTPLSAIGWYTEMLLDGDAGELNESQHKYLNEVHKGNARMVSLVNSLLNVSRLDLGTLVVDLEKLAIETIAKSAVADVKVLANEKDITINEHYDTLPKILLDKKLTRIIFQNLLSNAVKYSPRGSTVELSVVQSVKDIKIRVSDHGIGIPNNQHDKIFTKLFRASNVREYDTTGTGLGLYLVKSILDSVGGEIAFRSEEGVGTTFEVIIPIAGMKDGAVAR